MTLAQLVHYTGRNVVQLKTLQSKANFINIHKHTTIKFENQES